MNKSYLKEDLYEYVGFFEVTIMYWHNKFLFLIAPFSIFAHLVQIIPDSSADLAGLLVNDVIIKCDEKPVESFLEVCTFIM